MRIGDIAGRIRRLKQKGLVLDCDSDGGDGRSRRQGKHSGEVMTIESEVWASLSCVFALGSGGVEIYEHTGQG